MLSLGTGSSCDICFEPFNSSNKAPSSLTCGHVFCHMCIVQIYRLCPLCRIPFDSQAIITLRIETDNGPEHLHCTQESIDKAKQFTAQIYKIADDGITESQLQKLISDGRTFLGTQDRAMHRELRILFRLLKHLNTVKLGSREQTHTIEILTAKVAGLEQEKEEIRNLLANTESTRQMERDTAYAVEESLRGHIKRIQEHSDKAASAYLALVQLYNKISLYNKELINKLKNAGLSPGPLAEMYQGDNEKLPSSDPASVGLVSPMFDRPSLQGVAVRNPKSSYLISPLPQFTVPLPNIDKFVPLPELADDDEEEEDDESEDDEEELNTPDSGSNQGQFRDQYPPSHHHHPHPYPSRASTMPIPPQPVPPVPVPIPPAPTIKPNYEPSGISRSAPYQEHRRRERSRSNPIDRVPIHRRNPQDDIFAPSTPPTPPFTTETEEPPPPPSSSSYREPYVHPLSSSLTATTTTTTAMTTASQQSSRQTTSQSQQPYGSHYPSKHSSNPTTTTASNNTTNNNNHSPQITSEYPPMPMNEDRLSSSHLHSQSSAHQMDPILRLQNILSSDPPLSSSSSSSGRHFPSSYSSRDRERERERERERDRDRDRDRERHPSPPPRGGSSTSHTQTPTPQTQQQQHGQQAQYQQHHSQKPQPQYQYPHHPHPTIQTQAQPLSDSSDPKSLHPLSMANAPNSISNNGNGSSSTTTKAMSTASAQARILEEEKRKKYEEEKRRRQEERYQADERERERIQQQQEHDGNGRFSMGIGNGNTKYVSASASAAAAVATASASASASGGSGGNPPPPPPQSWRDQAMQQMPMPMSSSPGGMPNSMSMSMSSATTSSSAAGKRSGSISNVGSNSYGRM